MTLEELIETYPEAETYFKNMPEERHGMIMRHFDRFMKSIKTNFSAKKNLKRSMQKN